MRFVRVIGRTRKPVRPAAPSGSFTRRADPPAAAVKTAARPEGHHVQPASYVVLSILFSILLFAFFAVNDRGFLQMRRQRVQLVKAQANVSDLDKENRRLEEEIARLKSDPNAVEKIAREELNLVKPGEVVLVLPQGWERRVNARKESRP